VHVVGVPGRRAVERPGSADGDGNVEPDEVEQREVVGGGLLDARVAPD
jgi:hypothetical protein